MICHHNCGASPYFATRARDKAFGQGPGASLDTDMLFLKTPHAADDDLVDRTDPVPGRKVHSAAQRVSDSEWGLVDPNLLKSLLRKHHITPKSGCFLDPAASPGMSNAQSLREATTREGLPMPIRSACISGTRDRRTRNGTPRRTPKASFRQLRLRSVEGGPRRTEVDRESFQPDIL